MFETLAGASSWNLAPNMKYPSSQLATQSEREREKEKNLEKENYK